MKRVILMLAAVVGLGINVDAQFGKKVKEINVIPDNAKISIGGMEVGTGTYQITFDKKQDFIVVRLDADGYITKTVKINKNDKRNSFSYKLEQDGAYAASAGPGEGAADVANKPMRVVVKKGLSKSEAWKRIIYYVTENFETLEINDANAGWIRTAWAWQDFNDEIVIRTRIEVKEVMGQEDEVSYRITLSSQFSHHCGRNDQCFKAWDRILKKYDTMIKDLQNSIN